MTLKVERASAYLLLAALVIAIHLLSKIASGKTPQSAAFLSQPCYVGIEGLVKWPGIYGFSSPPSAWEVIRKAGGLREGFSVMRDFIGNQPLCGRAVIVSLVSKGKGALSIKRIDAFKRISLGLRINLNNEPAEDLVAIPGIGIKTARAIVAFREKRGSIASMSDLVSVPGIGTRTREAISKFCTLAGGPER